MRMCPFCQLVHGNTFRGAQLLKHKQLCSAESDAFHGSPVIRAQCLDNPPDGIQHAPHIGPGVGIYMGYHIILRSS